MRAHNHTVIDSTTGRTLLTGATITELDRWYDAHPYWRAPRAIEEVNPILREHYTLAAMDDCIHFYVQD